MRPEDTVSGIADAVALYLHVPFCRTKCDYCDFFSQPDVPAELQQQVVSETITQAEIMLEAIGSPGIRTMYIGGGTPTSLEPSALEQLVTGLDRLAEGSCEEFSCEANPESLSVETLRILRNGNVSRLSLGVQSFDESVRAFLGRKSCGKEIQDSLRLVGEFWEGELNIDVISELPGQSKAECAKDIETALSYDPDHLSVYSLQIEEETPLYRRMKQQGSPAPPPNISIEQLSAFLMERGFRQYEISNFCRPLKECRHNIAYWRMRPYLGCGPGAVSTLPGSAGIVRLENPKDIKLFLQGRKSGWGAAIDEIGSEEFLLEYLMMGLRLTAGIELREFETIFGSESRSRIEALFELWQKEGYAGLDSAGIRLTHRGMEVMNPLLLRLMDSLESFPVGSVRWP